MVDQVKVNPGKLIIRQTGGVNGTHELQLSHDGTNTLVESKLGALVVDSALTVTGLTTLATSLNGILVTTSGVVSGSANLDDINNVVLSGPVSGEALKFNGTNWVNGTAASMLDDLTDVILTTPAVYSSIVFDGTNWVDGATASSFKSRNILTDSFAGDDIETNFTLSYPAISDRNLIVTVGDVIVPASEYNLIGSNTLSFIAPPSVAAIEVKNLGNVEVVEDLFTGDGTNTTFTLSIPEKEAKRVAVYVGGVSIPVTDYVVNGTNLVFGSAPPVAPIKVNHLIDINYIDIDVFEGDGTTTVYTMSVPSISEKSLEIAVGDFIIPYWDYQVSGKTLTFYTAPPVAPIIVRHLSEEFYLADRSVGLEKLSTGTPGNLIVYDNNGTASSVTPAVAGIGWHVKESGSFSGVTEKVLNISKTSKVFLTNVAVSTPTDIRFTTSSDNGTSFHTSANDYHYSLADLGDAGLDESYTNPFIKATSATAITTAGYVGKFEISIWSPESGNVTLFDIDSSVWSSTSQLEDWDGPAARMAAEEVNAIRLYPGAGGTITGNYVILELN